MLESAQGSALLVLAVVPYYLLLLFLLALGKWFFDLTYRQFRLDQQMVKKDNPALALVFSGYMLALTLALLAGLHDLGSDWRKNLLQLGAQGLAILVLLRVSLFIQDRLILFRFSLIAELVERRNVAVGVVSAAGLLANGMIIAGALVGESVGLLPLLLDMLVFWGLGQLVLVVGSLLYRWQSSYNLYQQIGVEQNLAAGLAMAGFTLANGLIIQIAIWGSHSPSWAEFATTVIFLFAGFLLLLLSRWVLDVIFLPGASIKDEVVKDRNPAVGLVLGVFYLISALLFSSVLRAMVF